MATSSSLPNAATVTLPELQSTLALYHSVLMHLVMLDAKKKQKTGGVLGELLHLDRKRYEELPGVPDRTSMTKKDLTWAMDWKLCVPLTKFSQCPRASGVVKLLTENILSMHGTKRPSLPGLIAQNSEEVVESTTKSAFALYKSDAANYTPPLKKLEELKGVGPATASLLLSILDSDNAPFFSDELFRWVCWDEALGGWKRKIKYDKKEFGMLWEGVKTLRERLGKNVSAVDLEKCAYVCGKLAVDKKLEVEVRKDAEKRQNEAAETKSEGGTPGNKQNKDEVNEISKSPPIPTTAKTEQAKKPEPKPIKEKSVFPEPETEDSVSNAQASAYSASSPPIPTTAKPEHGKKTEPNPAEKKSAKRSSPEPETDEPLSDAQTSSTSSSPPKKAKTEHKKKAEEGTRTEPNKTSAKPAKPPAAAAPKAKSGPKPAAAASAATAGAAKPKTTKKASSASKAKKPAKLPSGGENSRVLRPRKEMSYET